MMSTQQKTDVNVIAVVNNSWSNAALDDEGRVWTWGNSNSSYRFGRDSSASGNRTNPFNRGGQVTETIDAGVPFPFILQISGSVENTLALDREGNVWSWGYALNGALGRSGSRERPGKVALPAGVKAKWIAAGYHGGKIIDTDGNIWVWGEGSQYGLGTGSTTDVRTPVKLTLDASNNQLPTNFVKISSSDYNGEASAIAVTADGKIYTWGNGGDADTAGARRPKQTGTNGDIKKICTGNGSFGFLTNSGEVWTWGDNRTGSSDGRLGQGDTNHLAAPKRIETVANNGVKPAPKFRDFSIYAWSMCAVDDLGNLYGCGQNRYNKHTGAGTPTRLTKYLPNGVPADTQIFIVSEGYTSTSYVDVHGNAYVTGESDAQGDNNNDGTPAGPWVHFSGAGKPMFTLLGSSPTSEAKRYNTLPRTTLNVETNVAADEIKYVILYPEDTEQYSDGETFYSKTFAEIEQPYYNAGTDPQLLLSPNYDLKASRYYANPKISEDVFEAIYETKAAPDKGTMNAVEGSGNKVFLKSELVSHNSIVWVQSKNASGTTRMVYRFDNYYTQTKAWFEGVKFDDPQFNLYPPELVGGGYGLFLDRQGNLLPGEPPFGYDVVKPVPNELPYWTLSPADQLAEEDAEDGYRHRVDRSKEIFLTDLTQKGDDATKKPCVTFTYEKNPPMWVDAVLYFVDESGGTVDVRIGEDVVSHEPRTQFAPKGAAHVDGQDPYIPPEAVQAQTKAIGYSIGTPPDGTPGSYTKADFPGGFKPVLEEDSTIYIVYTTGVVSIPEHFIDISDEGRVAIKNNNGQLSSEKNLKTGEVYDYAGPTISGYVIVGHEVVKGGVATPTEYPWEVDHYEPQNAYIGEIADGTEINFLYKADKNANKIPDDEEGRVLVRWIAVSANNAAYIIAQQTLCGNGKVGATLTIEEDKAHVLPTAQYDPDKWLFRPGQEGDLAPYDPRGSEATESITLSAKSLDEVYFYYDENYNENQIADKLEGHFTEKYKSALTQGDLDPPKADTVSKWLGGETYAKAAPTIADYVSVGYRIESADMEPVIEDAGRDQRGNVIVAYDIPFEDTAENYTVTFLYKEDKNHNNIPDDEEGSVTIRWKGTTYAGNDVELASLVLEGYIGDDVTEMVYLPAHIDDIWKLEFNGVPPQIILTAEPQEYVYEYAEVPEFSTITIETKSTDGNLDFYYLYTKKLTDAPFDVTAFDIPTYRVKGYVQYDNYGNEIRSGTADTLTINPATGSQKIVFMYESTVTTVVVRAIDSDDATSVLHSQTITDAVIGQKYAATAPYVDENWVLIDDVIQVIDVEEGTNYIIFEYERATGDVTVLLKENDANGPIIKVLSEVVGHGNTSQITIPDLSDAFYTQISTEKLTVDYTGAEPVPKTIEYYYAKEMMDVTVRAVDGANDAELKAEPHPAAARKGESYTAIAPTIEWYTIAESNSKSVYVDPMAAGGAIDVAFAYKKDNVGHITVRSFYEDKDGVEIDLAAHAAQSLVGSKFTAVASSFPGFELVDAAADTVQIVVDADDDKNKIEFAYIDLRKTVGVFTQIESDALTRQPISAEKYLSGSDVTIIPPYMNNHLVVGYIIDTEEMQDVDPENFQSLTINEADVTDGMGIVFVYMPVQKIVDEKYVHATIQGVTGAVTHYSYVKRIAKTALPTTLAAPADVFNVPGHVLINSAAADFAITQPTDDAPIVKTFHYRALATTVTIRMLDGSGNEVANSFAVGATADAPFTYNAPNVPHYYLTGSSLGKADPVLENGASEIVFTYAKITSQVTVIAKENDTNGRVIGVFEIAAPQTGTEEYAVPDLSADYYTANQPTVEITYDGTNSVSAEAYYTKDLADVEMEALHYLTGADLGPQAPLLNQRKGEAVSVSAPNVADHVLVGSAAQIVIADGTSAAVFKYRNLENDELAVKAVDPDGHILQSYILKGDVDETVTAVPPAIQGWETSDTEQSAIIGTDSEIVFNYTKNVVTVTVNTVDAKGNNMISSVAEVPRGGSYTAHAPHIPGYVVEGNASHVFANLVADQTVTFVVKPLETAVALITVIGNSADGELYRDIVVRPKNSTGHRIDADVVDDYRLISTSPKIVDIADEDVTVTFDYESLYTVILIYMVDEDTHEFLATFLCLAKTWQSYTFIAPNIAGYDLTSTSSTGTVSTVMPNGASEICFTYRKNA